MRGRGARARQRNDDSSTRGDELERARGLAVGLRPYYIEYQLEDVQTYTANATLGGLLTSMSRQYRVPLLDLRVGDYTFDSSNSVFANAYSGARFDAQSWPIDDRYDVLRRYLWLATDRSYKTALEAMSRKRSALKNMSEDPAEKLPDFWKAVALARIFRALKPGGSFYLRDIVFASMPEGPERGIEAWADYTIKNHEFARESVITHMRDEYSTFGWVIERLLTEAGFTLVSAGYDAPLHATYRLHKPKSGEQG